MCCGRPRADCPNANADPFLPATDDVVVIAEMDETVRQMREVHFDIASLMWIQVQQKAAAEGHQEPKKGTANACSGQMALELVQSTPEREISGLAIL